MGKVTAAAGAAANRFGLGARPGELAAISDARGWLDTQVARGAPAGDAFDGLPDSLEYLRREAALKERIRAAKSVRDPARRNFLAGTSGATAPAAQGRPADVRAAAKALRDDVVAEAGARFALAARTDTPFMERLVGFWSNHFAVSLDKGPARLFAAPLEREAIRPHVAGRFSDMLLAVETHPAMLRYLDNTRSTGPDSPVGERVTRRLARAGNADKGKAGGLNENLGREIMELHTVGVDGGYTQADVTELARALTGWSTPTPRELVGAKSRHGRTLATAPTTAFVFRVAAHEPGRRTVLGKTYADDGFAQGRAILLDLARHPATAHHLAHKLAQHFVADTPPPALVARLAQAYLAHDTDLAAVYRALIASPEAWGADARRFKAPQDFVISALRAGDIAVDKRPRPLLTLLDRLGEPWLTPRSPAGFADVDANWLGADALWKRVQAAEALAASAADTSMAPVDLARSVLGARLDDETATAIRRAESVQQAVATLFACPAFQWRV